MQVQPAEPLTRSIREHTQYQTTDHLYDPLRQTMLDPTDVQRHAGLTPIAAKSSMLSQKYHILRPDEMQRMVDFPSTQQQHTYIPNAQLYPTHNTEAVRNHNFVAVNSSERILGPPISPQELQSMRLQGAQRSEVVYDYQKPQINTTVVEQRVSSGGAVNEYRSTTQQLAVHRVDTEEKIESRPVRGSLQQPPPDRFTPQNYSDYGKKGRNDFKYNLFSMLDEPANSCRELGCGGCRGCPSNEIIASENRTSSLISRH